MTGKKQSISSVQLTLKKARMIAMQEIGTAKGLEKETTAPFGFFIMKMKNLEVRIYPDECNGRGRIVVAVELSNGDGKSVKILDPETLQEDFEAQEQRVRDMHREEREDWVNSSGAEYCHKVIDRIWNGGKG